MREDKGPVKKGSVKMIITAVIVAIIIITIIIYKYKVLPEKEFPKDNLQSMLEYTEEIIPWGTNKEGLGDVEGGITNESGVEIDNESDDEIRDTELYVPDIGELVEVEVEKMNKIYRDIRVNTGKEVYNIRAEAEDSGVGVYIKVESTGESIKVQTIKVGNDYSEDIIEYKKVIADPLIKIVADDINKSGKVEKFKMISYKGDKIVTYNEKGGPYIHEYRLNTEGKDINIKKFK